MNMRAPEDISGVGNGNWAPADDQAFLLRYFDENQDAGGLLPKDKVCPFALKALLPFLLLLEHTPDRQSRFTLVGTAVAAGYDHDFTGERLPDIHYSPCRNVYSTMIRVCSDMAQPLVCFGMLRYPNRNFLKTIKSIYPVTADGKTITHSLFLLSLVDKSPGLEFFYTPFAPNDGLDTLYGIGSGGADGAWPITPLQEIRYDAAKPEAASARA